MDKRLCENIKNKVGVSVLSKDGILRTCIAYRGTHDIDVKDEKGRIYSGVSWRDFYDKKSDFKRLIIGLERIGETQMNRQGEKMTIIEWNGVRNISVQFEDGIIRHTSYTNFLNGTVPKITQEEQIKNRIGQSVISQDGYKMTLIAFRSYQDVDIQYEDGEIKTTRYEYFTKKTKRYPLSHLGEEAFASDGSVIKCVAYRSYNDIDVLFDNGKILEHTTYHSFMHRKLKKPTPVVGEIVTASNGQLMQIIEYFDAQNCTVEFEDGTIVQNVSISHFREGKVLNPNKRISGVSYNELLCCYYLKQFGFSKMQGSDLENVGIYGFPKKMELDMFAVIKGVRFAVEYDGFRAHSKKSDKKKNILCKKNSIHLIRIREPETEKYNDTNIKMIYLSSGKRASSSLFNALTETINYINTVVGTNFSIDIDFDRDVSEFEKSLPELCTSLRTDRIGEIGYAADGSLVQIIAYRGAQDVDIEFEDGTISEHKYYSDFKNGKLFNPNNTYWAIRTKSHESQRVGMVRYTNYGERMECVAYRSCTDIDVKFEDGTIREHVSWYSFRDSSLAKIPGKRPYKPKSQRTLEEIAKLRDNILHTSKKMNNGQNATIIQVVGFNNISVRFDNGVVERCSYEQFIDGAVDFSKDKVRLGQRNQMSCGLEATIINYRNAQDIDIEFEDGSVVLNKSYSSFKIGQIAHPSIDVRKNHYKKIAEERLGIVNAMNCGMNAKIIAYRNNHDMDIEFEDGVIVHTSYDGFVKGTTCHPALIKKQRGNYFAKSNKEQLERSKQSHLGEAKTMNNGMKASIVAYRKSDDIDVLFEDGYLAMNKTYSHFKTGAIGNPNIQRGINKTPKIPLKEQRLGETRQMLCGLSATIISYETNKKITVQFEDGFIKKSSYSDFAKGNILHPKHKPVKTHKRTENCQKKYLGESKIMQCGFSATIIAYRRSNDIDVLFENGDIRTNVDYGNFKKGTITSPNIKEIRANNRIGETNTMQNGMIATIIEYRCFKDIDIQFEDGTTVYHKQYGSFKDGHIAYPKQKAS